MQMKGCFRKDGKVNMCFFPHDTVSYNIYGLCYETVAVVEKYNLCWYSDTKHKAKYVKVSL